MPSYGGSVVTTRSLKPSRSRSQTVSASKDAGTVVPVGAAFRAGVSNSRMAGASPCADP